MNCFDYNLRECLQSMDALDRYFESIGTGKGLIRQELQQMQAVMNNGIFRNTLDSKEPIIEKI